MSPKSRCSSEAASRRLPVACLLFVVAVAGPTCSPRADNPRSDLDGTQVASGWGPARPTARTRPRVSVPFGIEYDSVFLPDLDKPASARFFRLRVVTSRRDSAPEAVAAMSYLQYKTRGWDSDYWARAWPVPPHPLLAQILPDVDLYVTSIVPGYGRELCAAWKGRVYQMPQQFNVLLRDCGWEFLAEDIPDWARLLALIDEARRYARHWDGVVWGTVPVVPSVSFEAATVDTTASPEGAVVHVRMTVAGKPVERNYHIWMPDRKPGMDVLGHGLRCYPCGHDIEPLSEVETDDKSLTITSGASQEEEVDAGP